MDEKRGSLLRKKDYLFALICLGFTVLASVYWQIHTVIHVIVQTKQVRMYSWQRGWLTGPTSGSYVGHSFVLGVALMVVAFLVALFMSETFYHNGYDSFLISSGIKRKKIFLGRWIRLSILVSIFALIEVLEIILLEKIIVTSGYLNIGFPGLIQLIIYNVIGCVLAMTGGLAWGQIFRKPVVTVISTIILGFFATIAAQKLALVRAQLEPMEKYTDIFEGISLFTLSVWVIVIIFLVFWGSILQRHAMIEEDGSPFRSVGAKWSVFGITIIIMPLISLRPFANGSPFSLYFWALLVVVLIVGLINFWMKQAW